MYCHLFSWNCHFVFVLNQVSIYEGVYFWILYFVLLCPLFCAYTRVPVSLYHIVLIIFILKLLKSDSLPGFNFFPQGCFFFNKVLFFFKLILQLHCQLHKKNLLGLWWGLYWFNKVYSVTIIAIVRFYHSKHIKYVFNI